MSGGGKSWGCDCGALWNIMLCSWTFCLCGSGCMFLKPVNWAMSCNLSLPLIISFLSTIARDDFAYSNLLWYIWFWLISVICWSSPTFLRSFIFDLQLLTFLCMISSSLYFNATSSLSSLRACFSCMDFSLQRLTSYLCFWIVFSFSCSCFAWLTAYSFHCWICCLCEWCLLLSASLLSLSLFSASLSS